MYINYVLIFRKLEECYDQVVHPQKRRLIRHILDGTMGRWVYCEGLVGVGGVGCTVRGWWVWVHCV